MRNHKILFVFVTFCSCLQLFAEVSVKKNDGTFIKGTVVFENDQRIELLGLDSAHIVISKSDITDISEIKIYDGGPNGYFSYGVTVGTPGGLNAVIAHSWKKLGVRASVGPFGVQTDIMLNGGRHPWISSNAFLAIGYSVSLTDERLRLWTGIGVDFNIAGLFLNVGFIVHQFRSKDDFLFSMRSDQLFAQLGMVVDGWWYQ